MIVSGPELCVSACLWSNGPSDFPVAYSLLLSYAGVMRPLPEWILTGAAVGYEGGTDAVLGLWSTLEAAGVDVNSLWLQDWSGLRVGNMWALYNSEYKMRSACISIRSFPAACA